MHLPVSQLCRVDGILYADTTPEVYNKIILLKGNHAQKKSNSKHSYEKIHVNISTINEKPENSKNKDTSFTRCKHI